MAAALDKGHKMLEKLKERIKMIEDAIQQSIQNHNGLLGRHAELKEMAKMAEECCEKDVDVVVDSCEQAAEIPAE